MSYVTLEWELCPFCQSAGHIDFPINEDTVERYTCSHCAGQGEIHVEVELYEDEPTEAWFEEIAEPTEGTEPRERAGKCESAEHEERIQ